MPVTTARSYNLVADNELHDFVSTILGRVKVILPVNFRKDTLSMSSCNSCAGPMAAAISRKP